MASYNTVTQYYYICATSTVLGLAVVLPL